MTYTADRRVDAYIDSLPDWQQDICREVRALVHAADPEVTETIKRTKLPFFVLHGNVRALLAAKDHVNVFLYDGAMVPDPDGIITSGHENKTARTVALRRGEPIKTEPLIAMFRAIIANDRGRARSHLVAALRRERQPDQECRNGDEPEAAAGATMAAARVIGLHVDPVPLSD